MHIFDWNTLDDSGRRAALARPQVAPRAEIARVAAEVIEQVRRGGDAALRALTQRFDGVSSAAFQVTPEEFRAARHLLGREAVAALERAIGNVHAFHAAQLPGRVAVETSPGVLCEQITRPIARVGLYAPAGTAPLPSAVIMLAVPARIARCRQRILCTPPRRDASANPAILVAAELCGIEAVYKVGGAQAIAALAYGTATVPKVDKIFGPGNAWVTAAKQLVARDAEGAACDLPAGPSEVLVLADASARADFIAADLLAQAEHDALSQALLVTDCRELAAAVARELALQRATLTRAVVLEASLRACRALVVPDLATGMELANAYAPEHLLLHLEYPRRWLAHVANAGAVFLGRWSPEALGDYCSGTNHVLPTDGYARTASGLSVRDFLKTISVQEVTPAGLAELGPTAIRLASLEGLDGHAQSVARRLAHLAASGTETATRGVPA